MPSNNHEEDRHRGDATPVSSGRRSPSPPPPPPLQVTSSKTQALLRRRRRVLPRDVEQQEPWLFQSATVRPLPAISGAPRCLSLSVSDSSLFYLDLDSLKSLLPPPAAGRYRPKSSDHGYNNPSSHANTRGSALRKAPPARLEALDLSVSHTTDKQHRKRKHVHHVGAQPTSRTRKKALRIDLARVRLSSQELADTAAAYGERSPTNKGRGKKKKHQHEHKRHHNASAQHSSTKWRSSVSHAVDYDSDGQAIDREEKPVTPLEDLDEEQRQKAHIAAHLNLSLEEYERLDAAFGSGPLPSHASSEDSGSMTERYYELFQEFDVDDSGSISPDELRQLLLASGEDMDDAELTLVIQQADKDHDGEIDFDEFIALMRARKRLLLVANGMGMDGSGSAIDSNTRSPGFLPMRGSGGPRAPPLPPLTLAARQTKGHLQPQSKSLASRPTPTCLRPGSKVDIVDLRRELALSEYGIQELNSRVREGLQWVQQHCPVTSLKAQVFCHRWGMEKVHQLFLRLQCQHLSRAFQKWEAFRLFERNKIKANMFLKCKASQKMTAIMTKWKRKVTRRKFSRWKTECIRDARNELHSAAIEIQRIVRGDLARLLLIRMQEEAASIRMQALVRGHLARVFVSRKRRAKLEHEAACLLQHCYRGYTGKRLARALFKAQREALAACRIQRAFRNFQRREILRVIQRTKLENDSAIRLQCCMRGYLARRERKRRYDQRLRQRSALVLQRYTRGFLTRRRVCKMKAQIRAAVMIQCFYRVQRARRHIQSLRNQKLHSEQQALERAAATKIQANWRCTNSRKLYLVTKQREAEAKKLERFRRLTSAVRVQSLFRGYQARRRAQRARFEKLKWMNITLMNSSALKIQTLWRDYHGRLATHLRLQAQRALEHEENEAAKRIQLIARGKLARGERHKLDQQRAKLASRQRSQAKAALRIQKVFRGKQARKMTLQLQQKHREEAQVALDRLVHQTKTRAALKIQCCVRRFLSRCRYFHRKREVELRKKQKELQFAQEHAAIVIQCAMRRARARRILLQRRREFEKRISMMASEKAHDEIERLRKEQEEELLKLKLQLLYQESTANTEAVRLRDELVRQREEEEVRHKEESQELARLRLETLMQQREIDAKAEQERQKKLEAQRLREQLELDKQIQKEKEASMRTQENEELAALKMAAILQSGPASKLQQEEGQQSHSLQQEAAKLQQATEAIRHDQARMKIQAVCLKYLARKRLAKLQKEQAVALANIQSDEQRLRLKAEQDKELALARLKAMMDNEARAREQEIKELEVQMLERARREKERIALRNDAARKIQSRARGYLGRQRVKAIQRKIEKEREDRAKAMQETLDAAEAKVAVALVEAGEVVVDEADATSTADEWVEYWDENAQASYFFNIRTQEASWTRPVTTPSAKAMDIVMTATGRTTELEQEAVADYVDYAAASQVDANGYPVAASGGENYADEYGYYDQYGQYHYYEQNNAGYYGAPAYGQNYPQMMGGDMFPQFAAANYAFQAAAAAAAMGWGPSMMYGGAPMMAYGNQAMAPAPIQLETAPAVAEGDAPPDPWEKFFDQYTGAAYYYNSITGEQYWA